MKGDRNQARGLSPGSLRWGALVTGLVVAVAAIAAESPGRKGQRVGTTQPAASAQTAGLVRSARRVTVRRTGNTATSCPAPPLPAATHPPGATYGIPFVAALAAGQLLSGYDESIAASPPPNNPWRAKTYNISGWASGLLQVPSLKGQVDQVVFCYSGLAPPLGIIVELVTPGTATITNAGHCGDPGFIDFRLTISPDTSVPTTLSVTGAEPDGSLDLTGSTAVNTKVDYYACPTPPTPTQTCPAFASTQITFATKLNPPPPGAPPGVAYPLPPDPLHGPINTATATLVGNNFAVPAFKDQTNPGGCSIGILFNSSLAGFDIHGRSRYPQTHPQPRIASQPGWSEFQSATQIKQLG